MTVIAILLRHPQAREIAKTQRPCPCTNASPDAGSGALAGIEAFRPAVVASVAVDGPSVCAGGISRNRA